MTADRNGDSRADAILRGDFGRASGESPALTCRGTRLLVEVFNLALHFLKEAGISGRRAKVVKRLVPAVRVERIKRP